MQTKREGLDLASWLLLLFVGLKLTNFIDWSWWWVLSPLWLPFVILLSFLFIAGFCRLVFGGD